MTGFGNFLYFDKKADFSIERAISMWLRINYFPLLLSIFIGVPIDLLYIVPLHTTAFFITMITCYVAKQFEVRLGISYEKRNIYALSLCLLLHIIFYESPLVNILQILFGKEIHFRFQSDKYSAVLGMISGYFWHHAQKFVSWAHTPTTISVAQQHPHNDNDVTTNNQMVPLTSSSTSNNDKDSNGTSTTIESSSTQFFTAEQTIAIWGQRSIGVVLILLWYMIFGHINDKFTYNPIHPFVFWLPIFGWLMIRNSSKYLTEIHSTALEFFGKITLETYVLQFHVFMCRNVQHIPIVLPGSGPDGSPIMKFLNMIVTGIGFVALAYWARQITVTTQTTVTDLVVLLLDHQSTNNNHGRSSNVEVVEKVPLTAHDGSGDNNDEENKANGTTLKDIEQ
jgi:N-acetylneuraminate 9-O-acetyltransferase